MDNLKLFDEALPGLIFDLKRCDIASKAEILGIQKRGDLFVFDFFNEQIAFDGNDFFSTTETELTPALKTLFCQYILMCPENKIQGDGKLVTFREFSDSGPLFARFAANTGKIIQTSFAGKRDALSRRCLKLGGNPLDNASYDISFRFRALPRIPVILNFNDSDELMPASAGFLYHETASIYLNLQSLSITCTYLTGLLIQNS